MHGSFWGGLPVIATHPQIVEFAGDANSEYSIWPDSPYVTRFVNSFGIQSPHLAPISEQQVADAYFAFSARSPRGAVEVPEGETARQVVAQAFRSALSPVLGIDLGDVSDTEILDAHLYHLYPAFAPWAGVGQSLTYRWRPGPTPDTCFMDVLRMMPVPDGQERPAPAPIQRLRLDQSWKEAEGMGGLADVFEQDMANLPRVQLGLKVRTPHNKQSVSFGNYQEARLRMAQRLTDELILEGLQRDGRSRDEVEPFLIPNG